MDEPYKTGIPIGDKVLTISGLPALYLDVCAIGAVTGTVLGGLIGLTVGTTVAVASPVLVGGAIYKGVRYALRK
jgi:hypothetical protein